MAKIGTKYKILIVVGFLVLVVDQWTKHLIHTRVAWGSAIPVINGIFDITYVRNSGAAFGFMNNAPAYFREPFFIVVPLVVLFVIFFLFIRLRPKEMVSIVALSLVFSGAIGNLIDRLRFGWVIDFLDVHWKEVYHWPSFNVADSSIVVGVCLLLLQSLLEKNPAK